MAQFAQPKGAPANVRNVSNLGSIGQRKAFFAKTVQKAPTYPIVEHQAQSTTRPVALPNAKRAATTMATVTATRHRRMFSSRRGYCAED
jgi:hypothetical protein